MKYISKTNALLSSPTTSDKWKNKSKQDRIEEIKKQLKKYNLNYIETVNTEEDGQVILKIEKQISAGERGLLLLDLEEKLKKELDEGITIWLEPVGDKSKLRNLRGINIKTHE
tara:strand:- start:157 stop:495 length:339 start_codon:yes stop_codon:yes gene_type:complete